MCGIAGLVDLRGGADQLAVHRMVDRVRHRGPDDSGVKEFAHCVLGHARLAIIDPVGGQQPMLSVDGRYALTFNGTIYNFRALRVDLEVLGAHFRTQSDTEVLLRAYETWGDSCLARLNGQFAFAIWDEQEQRLFAARDRFGEKPLYFSTASTGALLFGSEIKQLLVSDLVRPQVDLSAVAAYLALHYVPPTQSIYANVWPLPPAHAMSFQDGVVSTWRYWELPLSENAEISEEEAARHVRSLVEQAVSRQMVADVPLGAFLSGGVDSATVVAAMARSRGRAGKVMTFSAGFGDLIDETPFARAVADKYDTDHREIAIQIDAAQMVRKMASVYDEPFGDSSNIPTYLISEFARRHTKVVLTGDGGDELFGGYGWYRHLRGDGGLAGMPHAHLVARAAVTALGPFRRVHAQCNETYVRLLRAKEMLRLAREGGSLMEQHLAISTHLSSMSGIDASHLRARAESSVLRPPPLLDGMDRVAFFDLSSYLPGDILVKVDRASLAHGLEARSPFLDVDLASYVLSLASSLRLNGSPKRLLRRACSDLWPTEIRDRPKMGFGAPVLHWTRDPQVEQMIAAAFSPRSLLRELLPELPESPKLLRAQHQWAILALSLWLETWGNQIDSVAMTGGRRAA